MSDSFYTKIDPRQKGGDTRTFIILPSKDSQTKSTLKHFTGNKNSNAANEVDAYVGSVLANVKADLFVQTCIHVQPSE